VCFSGNQLLDELGGGIPGDFGQKSPGFVGDFRVSLFEAAGVTERENPEYARRQ